MIESLIFVLITAVVVSGLLWFIDTQVNIDPDLYQFRLKLLALAAFAIGIPMILVF